MVIDTSVLLVILRNGPDAARFVDAIVEDSERVISAATLLETSLVLAGQTGTDAVFDDLDHLVRRANMLVMPVGTSHALTAREAFLKFGKGRGHPARLNFGDCLVYACAKLMSERLLFRGGDFHHTDLILHPASIII